MGENIQHGSEIDQRGFCRTVLFEVWRGMSVDHASDDAVLLEMWSSEDNEIDSDVQMSPEEAIRLASQLVESALMTEMDVSSREEVTEKIAAQSGLSLAEFLQARNGFEIEAPDEADWEYKD